MCYNRRVEKVDIVIVKSLNNLTLEKIEHKSNELFITATRSLAYQLNKDKKENVIDYTQLYNFIKSKAKEKDCLYESEMRYILHKTIKSLPDDDLCKQAFLNSQSLLYDLYNNLLMNNIYEQVDLSQIEQTQLSSNYKLFKLYKSYVEELNKQKKQTFQETFKLCLEEYFMTFAKVSFVGFTFFNDIQNCIFDKLWKYYNKVNKFIVDDDFIVNDFLIPYLNKKNIDYELKEIENSQQSNAENLKFEMYKPFSTREMEFEFIISKLVQELKQDNSKEKIQEACEDFAIVITNQFSKQTQIFNDLFKRHGVFISPDNQIFFSQEEFLQSNYKSYLSKKERLTEFYTFTRLEVYEPPKAKLFNTNLGRFVSEIYKISANGMKLDNFITLLKINWLFKETAIDDIISEFNAVKDFFENLEELEDWKSQIAKLISLKKSLVFNAPIHLHPLKAIRLESLEFIQKYILFLDSTIRKIRQIKGSAQRHIKVLVELLKSQVNDIDLATQLLNLFAEILRSKDNGVEIDFDYFAKNFQLLMSEFLSSQKEESNNIRVNAINLESVGKYKTVFVPMFEENKYPMGFSYSFPYSKEVVDILQDDMLIKNYNLPLNLTMDYNLKLSNYVFNNLFNIAQEKVIFTRIESEQGRPLDWSVFAYDIHGKMDLQTLKVDNSKDIEISKDFGLIFKDLKLKDMNLNEMLEYFVCPKMFNYMIQYPDKNSYTDKFLLNFYCRALIVNKTLTNLANGTTYTEQTIKPALNESLKQAAKEVFEILPMFDSNNRNDILLATRKQVNTFVDEKILTGRYKPKNDFILTLGDEKVIEHKGIKVNTHKTLVVKDIARKKDYVFDISKNLDYLTSSSGGKQTEKKHFDEIITELEIYKKYIDRGYSLNFLGFKLNTQLNTPKFENDGIERTKKVINSLSDIEIGNKTFVQSSYCSYCKFKNICKGGMGR